MCDYWRLKKMNHLKVLVITDTDIDWAEGAILYFAIKLIQSEYNAVFHNRDALNGWL